MTSKKSLRELFTGNGTHAIIGFVIIVLALLQLSLGQLSTKFLDKKKETRNQRVVKRLHKGMGYTMVLLATYQLQEEYILH